MPSLLVDQVLTGTALGLSFGLTDLFVLESGGRRVLYALSRTESALVEIDLLPDGTLAFADNLALAGTFAVGSDPGLGLMTDLSGSHSLLIEGLPATAGQTVPIAPDGSLGNQASLSGIDTLVSPEAVLLGSGPAVLTGRLGAGGLDLLTDTGSGFEFSASLSDSFERYLGDVSASVFFNIGGTDYLASTSASEDGLNLVEVTPSTLVQRDALGASEGLPINTPVEVGIIQRMSETLLVTGSFDTSSLSVVRVGAGAELQIADHIIDSPETRFQGLSALDTFLYGDFAFVAAGGADGGVSLLTVLPGGRLVHIDSLEDDTMTSLYRVSSIELASTGARLNLLVSSAWETGITRIGYDLSALGVVLVAAPSGGNLVGTSGSDQIVGSSLNDTLVGDSGDDILADGAGQDVLSGGSGSDLFVLHLDGQPDEITDYDRAEDRLDLSSWDFLYDVSQLSINATADGAILSHGAETLAIRSSDGAALTPGDFSNATILNVDRPSFLAIAQTLQGGAAGDTLNGGAGNDTISGAGADDVLTGARGNDSITGGAGNDTLDGGVGADTLTGEAGADLLVGGTGPDQLMGGAGDDVIYGDEYDWFGA